MILTEKINIKISPRNYNHFKKLGYVLKVNDFIKIKTEELSENSKLKINYYWKDYLVINNIK